MRRIVMGVITGSLAAMSAANAYTAPSAADLHDSVWANAPIVVIEVTETGIHPYRTVLHLNRPVRLVFRNDSGETNKVVFGNFYSPTQLRRNGIGTAPMIRLDPADRKELDLVPTKLGSYQVATTLSFLSANFWESGQRGVIEVVRHTAR